MRGKGSVGEGGSDLAGVEAVLRFGFEEYGRQTGPSPTMDTGVPMTTFANSMVAISLGRRMHP